jgi:hypothetical protein
VPRGAAGDGDERLPGPGVGPASETITELGAGALQGGAEVREGDEVVDEADVEALRRERDGEQTSRAAEERIGLEPGGLTGGLQERSRAEAKPSRRTRMVEVELEAAEVELKIEGARAEATNKALEVVKGDLGLAADEEAIGCRAK